MNEIVKGVFTAPLATVFVIAGVIFLFVAVVGNISGKIEPSTKGRVISGLLGLVFISIGLAMHFTQMATDVATFPVEVPAQKKPIETAVMPKTPIPSETKAPDEAVVSTPNIETKQPAAAVAANSTELIEAGCSFSADQIEGDPGSTNIVACPAGCDGDGVVYGTDVYTGHTYICIAAIHAGLINSQQGGTVGVIIEKGHPAYRGSTRNKVHSYDYGKFSSSFRLAPVK
jgi:LCCL domain